MNKVFRLVVVAVLAFLLIVDIFYSGTLSSTKEKYRYERNVAARDTATTNIPSPPPTTSENPYLIDGVDRFAWYYKKAAEHTMKIAPNVSLLHAYEFDHEITVTITSWRMLGFRVYCRYLDVENQELGDAVESLTYPEYIVNCPKRNGTNRIGVSVEKKGKFESVPIIDRMMREPKYELSMCVAPLYGDEPKWLQIIEMVEHFKLQGVQHFYLHIHNATTYDLKVVNDYVRTGEMEVHYLLERDQRADNHWHMVNIADCLIWSRAESKWTIFADLDERILMTKYDGTILDYLRKIHDEKVGGIQFRQQWVLKTELMPEKYEGDQQLDTWMPTHRWHNSSGIGPKGHTAKCIVDTSKVFDMWVHSVTSFFPGKGYFLKKLEPEEGIVRHYRDQALGKWGEKWLNSTLQFGPLTLTDYPKKYIGKLTENVKKRARYVYGNDSD